jgi:hypothetical protein
MCHKYTSLLENYPIYQNRKRLVTTQKYNILEHLGALTRSGESKTKYYCPVCQKNDFDVNPNTGKYGCFSGGCDPKDIRAAIDELEGKPKWQPEINNWVKPKRSKSRKEFIYLDRDGNPLVNLSCYP